MLGIKINDKMAAAYAGTIKRATNLVAIVIVKSGNFFEGSWPPKIINHN